MSISYLDFDETFRPLCVEPTADEDFILCVRNVRLTWFKDKESEEPFRVSSTKWSRTINLEEYKTYLRANPYHVPPESWERFL